MAKRKKPRKTGAGRELFEAMKSLEEHEQDEFVNIVLNDRTTVIGKVISLLVTNDCTSKVQLRWARGKVDELQKQIASKQPVILNAERDKEIIFRKHEMKQTAGQIVFDMVERFPGITDKIVNRVLSTHRRKATTQK